MDFGELVELLETITKDYGSVISIITGILGLLFTILFGGKLFQKLVRHRIEHLEEQLDNAKHQIHQYQADIDTKNQLLKLAERDHRDATEKLARIRSAFTGSDDQNVWLGPRITQPDNYHNRMPKSIPIMLIANLKGGIGALVRTYSLDPQPC
jgi:hypothetical protein